MIILLVIIQKTFEVFMFFDCFSSYKHDRVNGRTCLVHKRKQSLRSTSNISKDCYMSTYLLVTQL